MLAEVVLAWLDQNLFEKPDYSSLHYTSIQRNLEIPLLENKMLSIPLVTILNR